MYDFWNECAVMKTTPWMEVTIMPRTGLDECRLSAISPQVAPWRQLTSLQNAAQIKLQPHLVHAQPRLPTAANMAACLLWLSGMHILC